METQTGTNAQKPEPAVPFAPEIRRGLPPEAAFLHAIRALGVGCSTAFPLDFVGPTVMPRYVERYTNKERKLTLRTESDRYVVTKLTDGPVARGKGIAVQLMELQMGQDTIIQGPRVSTVRSVASALLQRDKPMRFSVTELGPDQCRVTRIELSNKDRQGWSRYQFGNTGPGGQFTVPAADHSGIESMRASCSYHSSTRGLIFKARQNIDGSITVRCYAEGGMPPKWAIDREHAELQAKLQAASNAA